MVLKPISASDVIRQFSPRKTIGNTFFSNNRFSHLRASSPADSVRSQSSQGGRSQSLKRKIDESSTHSYASAVAGGSAPPAHSQASTQAYIDEMYSEFGRAASLCDAISDNIKGAPEGTDKSLIAALNNIHEVLRITNSLQGKLLTNLALVGHNKQVNSVPLTDLGATSKRLRSDISSHARVNSQVRTANSQSAAPSAPPVDPAVKRFRDAVKEAEKSTLVFNLNMGKVPIMNQQTISSKATTALTEMAASSEGKAGRIPSNESVAAIDDVLSVVTGMAFYGKATKTYRNPKDKENSGAFCTVPVKYTFKDKDTRIRAEMVLRDTCKVNCSTPYPVILRDTIRQVVNYVKSEYPDNMVRVNVDLPRLGLRVARKPPGEGQYWKDYKHILPLPAEVFDVSARKVPDNFNVMDLPINEPRVPDPSQMDTDKSPPLRRSRRELFAASPKTDGNATGSSGAASAAATPAP